MAQDSNTISQRQSILLYLQDGYWITGLVALNEFGCMSLPKRICELIKEGHPIKKSWYKTESGKQVRKYFL